MSFFSTDLSCSACLTIWWDLIPREEKDRTDWPCPHCNAEAGQRVMGAPMVLQRTIPDGTKRFQKLRNQDAVDRAMSEARTTGDRVKLAQERDKIGAKKT